MLNSFIRAKSFAATNTAWKCPYSEFLWSVFSRIRTEYGEILRISPYSVQMQENTDQKNSECGHFSLCQRFIMIEFYDDKII